jgi:type IV pilus assembly protein PilB
MANQSLTDKLAEIHRREEEASTKNLAQKLNLPYLDLFGLPIDPDGLKILPEETAKKAGLIIVRKQGKKLEIALVDPENTETKEALANLQAKDFEYFIFLASSSSIKDALPHYREINFTEEKKSGQVEISAETVSQVQGEISGFENIKEKISQIPTGKISDLLEIIIGSALKIDASDVHFEPKEDSTILKYRLDGILHEISVLPVKTYDLILSRIKILSGIKLNIKTVAQDGRFTIKLPSSNIEIRVSIIPGTFRENIVLRILNPKTIALDLEDLGFRAEELELLEKEIHKPNGLIITTGPTGSGKTTTLYAFIKKVMRPEIKIITLEDPVEYRLPGITQTQVESENSHSARAELKTFFQQESDITPERGYTFGNGLRAILRQDPDVILIGEIRDSETAKTAINASLTGHLVFSTLHTNDAAGAIPRLIDLGADLGSLSASLNLIMAQRLVRRLCPDCRKEYKPDKEILEKIEKELEGIAHSPVEKTVFYKPAGCSLCNHTGYKGRIGILELIQIDPEFEKLIASRPSHADIVEFVKKKKIITMHQDALLKTLAGVTTLEEINRVIEES